MMGYIISDVKSKQTLMQMVHNLVVWLEKADM